MFSPEERAREEQERAEREGQKNSRLSLCSPRFLPPPFSKNNAIDPSKPTNDAPGDALLNYENEIIATNEAGEVSPLPYVVPPSNIKVKMPVATVDGNLRRWPSYSRKAAEDAARAFVEYCFTPEAQQELNDAGFRPVVKVRKPRHFPKVKKLLSVEEDFGGWDAVLDRINDAVAGR